MKAIVHWSGAAAGLTRTLREAGYFACTMIAITCCTGALHGSTAHEGLSFGATWSEMFDYLGQTMSPADIHNRDTRNCLRRTSCCISVSSDLSLIHRLCITEAEFRLSSMSSF